MEEQSEQKRCAIWIGRQENAQGFCNCRQNCILVAGFFNQRYPDFVLVNVQWINIDKNTPPASIINVESKLDPLDAFLCNWKPGNYFSTNSTWIIMSLFKYVGGLNVRCSCLYQLKLFLKVCSSFFSTAQQQFQLWVYGIQQLYFYVIWVYGII